MSITMDSVINKFPAKRDADLMLCLEEGVAYQRRMVADEVLYDARYLDKCAAYENSATAIKVVQGRCAMLRKHLAPQAFVLDMGVGSGAFMRAAEALGFQMRGFDVIPCVADRLKKENRFSDQLYAHDAVTFWDSLEHMTHPGDTLKRMRPGAMAFISLPIFTDLKSIRASKHYRPGEHLYYWTREGFINWMNLNRFTLREESSHEVDAGRESIGAFSFKYHGPSLTN